jgi:sarcosine oxidase
MYEILTGFGVPAELIPAAAAAERWPGLSFGPDPVMFHPDAGVIDPERAMAALRAIAAARGAQVCYGTPVLRVEADGEGAAVHTADRSWRAPVVVVAAGAWLEPLLGGHVPLPPLVVTQEEAFHFAQRPRPGLAGVHLLRRWRHVRPARGAGRRGAGRDQGRRAPRRRPDDDGEDRDGIVRPEARARAIGFVRDWLPGLDPAPAGEVTCLYTSTVNEDFILDRHGPFVVCSPCSGHGAKFAPLTGEIVADLACGGTSPSAASRWRPTSAKAAGSAEAESPCITGPGRPLVRRRRRTDGSGGLRSEPKWLPIC